MTGFWMATGPIEHWKIAFRHDQWGVRDGDQLDQFWREIEAGDVLFCYATDEATSDRGRLIGIAIAGDTWESARKLWTADVDAKTEYPRRIGIDQTIYRVNFSRWKSEGVDISDEFLGWLGSSLRPIRSRDDARKLYARARSAWDDPSGSTPVTPMD